MTVTNVLMSVYNYMASNVPTTNFDSATYIGVGEVNNAVDRINRGWIKPDFSGIAAGQVFSAATLYLTPNADFSSNERTMYAGRCLRATVSTQQTWNIFSTGNNWGSGGCSNSSTDYDGAALLGNMTQPEAPTLNVALSMTLSHTELQTMYDGTYTNNGIVLFVDTQLDDQIRYATPADATSGYRPYIAVTHAAPVASSGFWMFF